MTFELSPFLVRMRRFGKALPSSPKPCCTAHLLSRQPDEQS